MARPREGPPHQHLPAGAAADDGGRGPKRLIANPDLRARAEIAHHHGLPTSELNEWEPDDLANELDLHHLKAESCSGCGIHPSVWKPELGGRLNAVVAVWKHCVVCERIELAKDAGPPTEDKGWHLTLQHNH